MYIPYTFNFLLMKLEFTFSFHKSIFHQKLLICILLQKMIILLVGDKNEKE